jgi:CRISPR/Cas system-associated protein Cas5 (RAMP superfamily)
LKNNFDHNLYYNVSNERFYVVLILYVDDVLLTRNDIPKLIQIEEELEKCYAISRLGITSLYIIIEFLYFHEEIILI